MKRLLGVVTVTVLLGALAWVGWPADRPVAMRLASQELAAASRGAPASADTDAPSTRGAVDPTTRTAGELEGPTVRLRGRCVAAEDGRPLAGARVQVGASHEPPRARSTSGPDGRFLIDAAELDVVCVAAEGRVARRGRSWNPESLLVRDLGDIRLHRAWPIQGRVVDRLGHGVAAIAVEVELTRESEVLEPLIPAWPLTRARAESGTRGSFQLDALVPAGAWTVRLPAGWLCLGPRTFWVDPERGADPVTLTVDRAPEVSGQVVDEDGQPLQNVEVAAEPRLAVARTGDDGTFRLMSSQPVQGAVRIVVPPHRTYERPAVPIVVSWGSKDVTVVLRRPRTCRVVLHVVDDHALPVPEFDVLWMHEDELLSYGQTAGSHFRQDQGFANPQGHAVIPDARRGRSLVRVLPTAPGLLASEPTFVDAGDGMPLVRVVLPRMRACPVAVVCAGRPLADAAVDLVRVGADVDEARGTNDDAYRSSRLPMLGFPHIRPPEIVSATRTRADGTATLLAPPDGCHGYLLRVHTGPPSSLFVLDPPLVPATPLRLEAEPPYDSAGAGRADRHAEEQPLEPAELRGRVRGMEREPSWFQVSLVRRGGYDHRSFPLAADGSFLAIDLAPGHYHVALSLVQEHDEPWTAWCRVPGILTESFDVAAGARLQREFRMTARRLVLELRTPDHKRVSTSEVRVGTWQRHVVETEPLILDPAPELPVQVRLPDAAAIWSAPITMPRDRREHTAVVVVPALSR